MGVIKKIGGLFGKLRGKALKVALSVVVTVGCIIFGVNLPEPTKHALINGAAIMIEGLLDAEEVSIEPGEV